MLSEETEPAELSSSCTVFSQAQDWDIKYHAYQHGQKSKMSVEVRWLCTFSKPCFKPPLTSFLGDVEVKLGNIMLIEMGFP